ncbi:MAG: phenylalanine--tRNA ligase beta subunit-related protein [Chloroflexota bacterium]
MRFLITDDIFEQFPETQIGVIVASRLDNSGESAELTTLLREAEANVRTNLAGITVSQHPHVAPWREAYRKFGAKPKKYPSSIENLIKRTLKGEELRPINPLVDLYNVVSLRHLLPAGGEDLAQIAGDVRLTIAGDDEPAVQLLGEREARPPYVNEVIYTDDVGAICRRWNWKEADRTKLTAETTDAILVLEILPPVDRDALDAAMTDLANLIHQFCGESVQLEAAALNTGNRSLEI